MEYIDFLLVHGFSSKVWLKFPWFAKVEFEGSTIGRCLVVACAEMRGEKQALKTRSAYIGVPAITHIYIYITHTVDG